MKKYTVTIGIPAYNEGGNIKNEVISLLACSHKYFKLERIIIISDGSTDNTVSSLRDLGNNIIQVQSYKTRKGKPDRVNEILHTSTSDILILLDADLKIVSITAIDDLIKPFYSHANLGLVSGLANPQAPHNVVQKMSHMSVRVWEKAISYAPNNEMYYCSGPVRAFHKNLYKKLKFINKSADDAYSYFSCISQGFSFVYVRTGFTYLLPRAFRDLIRQSVRFIQSQKIQSSYFTKDLIDKYYTVTFIHKLKATVYYLTRKPLIVTLYVLTRAYVGLISAISSKEQSAMWTIATSTKQNI